MSQSLLDAYKPDRPGDKTPESFWDRLYRQITGHRHQRGLRRPAGKKPTPPEMRAHFTYWLIAFGVLLIILIQATMFLFVFSFMILAGRNAASFLPLRDYAYFVGSERVAYRR